MIQEVVLRDSGCRARTGHARLGRDRMQRSLLL